MTGRETRCERLMSDGTTVVVTVTDQFTTVEQWHSCGKCTTTEPTVVRHEVLR